jgi:hypothetical protein
MDTQLEPPSRAGLAEPHLDEDQVLDLLLDLLPEQEIETIGQHLSCCARCEEMVRRRGASLERRRASEMVAAGLEAAGLGSARLPSRPGKDPAQPDNLSIEMGRLAGVH